MATANPAKVQEADKFMKKGHKYYAPSLLDMRLRPDWESAAPMFEKAGLAYKQAGLLDKARSAYEKAAQAQEKLNSPWHAAKHLETCGAISKDMEQWSAVAEHCRSAANLYSEAGRASTGADALARGAKQLEERSPADAVALYRDAIDMYEADGKEAQAADVFRQAIAMLIRTQQWSDAVSMLMRFGEACDQANARSSQCKAYLGAVIVWLYAENAKEAWQVFQDTLQVANYTSSEEAFAADALFMAYKSGSVDKVKAVVSTKSTFKHLDSQVARLALKLPTGDVQQMGRQLESLMGGAEPGAEEGEGSEDELT